MIPPARGFPQEEYQARTKGAQALMAEHHIAALLLTTEPEVRYYTGFLTRFWESPTRPWFVIVPAKGDPIAVIPAIGAHLMGQTWINDISTWAAPNYDDDGVTPLAKTLCEVVPDGGNIGLADAMESHARMPLASLQTLQAAIGKRRITGDQAITRQLRDIKSEPEIAKIKQACAIANRTFARVNEIATLGTPLSEVFRKFQMLCLEEGADWVPYLAGAAGQGGYGDVISPATDTPLATGDVLMLDTGLVWDGYFCDFDRNFSIGPPTPAVADAHRKLIEATQEAFDIAKPGTTFADLFHAMDSIVHAGPEGGRLGHGLGMQLTEGPSIIAADHTVLQPGMVLTLEPAITLSPGKIMVHEENIAITNTGARYLSDSQPAEISQLC